MNNTNLDENSKVKEAEEFIERYNKALEQLGEEGLAQEAKEQYKIAKQIIDDAHSRSNADYLNSSKSATIDKKIENNKAKTDKLKQELEDVRNTINTLSEKRSNIESIRNGENPRPLTEEEFADLNKISDMINQKYMEEYTLNNELNDLVEEYQALEYSYASADKKEQLKYDRKEINKYNSIIKEEQEMLDKYRKSGLTDLANEKEQYIESLLEKRDSLKDNLDEKKDISVNEFGHIDLNVAKAEINNIYDLAHQLKVLNPNVDIKVQDPSLPDADKNAIYSSVPLSNLNLPDGFNKDGESITKDNLKINVKDVKSVDEKTLLNSEQFADEEKRDALKNLNAAVDTTPEETKKAKNEETKTSVVDKIKNKVKSIVNVKGFTKAKKIIPIAVAALGAACLLATPAIGGLIMGGAGVAAVSEFQKGAKGKF